MPIDNRYTPNIMPPRNDYSAAPLTQQERYAVAMALPADNRNPSATTAPFPVEDPDKINANRTKQKTELFSVLREQMEAKKERDAEEKKRREDEERVEEERVAK
jgi:hypothetical protein